MYVYLVRIFERVFIRFFLRSFLGIGGFRFEGFLFVYMLTRFYGWAGRVFGVLGS